MEGWTLLLVCAVAGSVVSLAGGFYMLYGKVGAAALQRYAVPFAAGSLLAATFFDLLPEALGSADTQKVLSWALVGFLVFFLLEHFLRWFHHHHEHGREDQANRSLIIIGDTMHNFIDGLAIGAAFLASPATGVAVTVAVAAHEIPQEVGDFGLLLSKGMKRGKIVLVNLASAVATIIGAAVVYGCGQQVTMPVELLMAVTAGCFLYIAASDIIPSIHQVRGRAGNVQALVLLMGVVVVMIVADVAHGLAEG